MIMTPLPSLRRTMLYVPGHRQDLIAMGRASAADVVCIDLEDNVPPGEKPVARELVARAIREGGFRALEVIVRINSPHSEEFARDAEMLRTIAPAGLLVPKVDGAEEATMVRDALGEGCPPLWCMIETARALINLESIATTAPPISAMVIGAGDLGHSLHVSAAHAEETFRIHGARLVATARAYGVTAIEGIIVDPNTPNYCGYHGRSTFLGQDAEAINAMFSPSGADVEQAKAALDKPYAYGDHLLAAQRTLDFAAQTAERSADLKKKTPVAAAQ